MYSFALTGEHWALLIGVVANRKYIVELLAREFVNGLRTLIRDIDADFTHRCNRFGPNEARINSSAVNFKPIARHIAQETFSHLASG
jgi:hypothetical protein